MRGNKPGKNMYGHARRWDNNYHMQINLLPGYAMALQIVFNPCKKMIDRDDVANRWLLSNKLTSE